MKLGMKRGVALGGTLISMLMMTTAAQAAVLSVSDSRPVRGQGVIVSGGGCRGGVRVTVTAFGNVTIGAARTNGTFDVQVFVPDGARVGAERTISARCWDGDSRRNFSATVQIAHELSGPTQVDPGDTVTYTGGGCAPNARIIVSFRGFDVETDRAGSGGGYSVTFRIPPGASAGDATIAVRCDQTYPPGSRHVDRKIVDVS